MRIGVKFARAGLGRFLSHLDLQDLFCRAVRRAGIPAKYTEGFHPHMSLSFASAMAVGMETEGDYFELQTAEEIEIPAAREALSAQMPQGFSICAMGRLPEGLAKLMALAVRAEYEIFTENDAFRTWLGQVMAQQSYIITKQRKQKSRQMDLRPIIYEADLGRCTRLMLGNFGAETVTPKLLLAEAEKNMGSLGNVRVVRQELYAEQKGEIKALCELFI